MMSFCSVLSIFLLKILNVIFFVFFIMAINCPSSYIFNKIDDYIYIKDSVIMLFFF
jgi:hypothetical protein